MLRIVHAIVTGVIGAALLHLVIVFALPRFSDRDTYSRVLALGGPGLFHGLFHGAATEGTQALLAPEDPFVQATVCAFDLSASPRTVTAVGTPEFWSFAVFDRAANEVFSLSDRSIDSDRLDAIIATKAQAALLRKADPGLTERVILVETAGSEGYVVLRALAPHASMEPEALGFLKSARCDALARP